VAGRAASTCGRASGDPANGRRADDAAASLSAATVRNALT
jgi:hypothetical protein